MKKNLINLSVLCILLCCTFFYACQENIEEEISPDIQELTHPNQVAAEGIKQWFEKNEKKLNHWSRSKANLRTNSLILPFFEKQPDWSKFHQYRFPDGRQVYEVNLDNSKIILSPEFKDKFPRETWKENVIQNLMFVQDSLENSYDLYIARYYPDQTIDTKNFKDISYADLGSEWSGEIALYGFDETHLISFMIKDRKISSTKKYALSPETSKKQYGASSMTSCTIIWQPGPCVPHEVGIGITCYDSYTILCEGEPQSYFEVSTDYQDGIGGGSYNPGDGPGDDEGEETIEEPELLPPPDFNPFTEEYDLINALDDDCASEILENLKTNLPQLPVIPEEADDFAQAILDLFEFSDKFNYIVKDASISGNGNTDFPYYEPNTDRYYIVTTLNETYLNNATKLSIVRTMIHESVHAYLLYEQRTNPFDDPYDAIRQYMIDKGITDANVLHHEFMSYYIDAVASSLQNWDFHYGDGGTHGWQFYQDLAWGGLTHHGTNGPLSEAFIANYPNTSDRNRILNTIQNEATGNQQAKGTPCN